MIERFLLGLMLLALCVSCFFISTGRWGGVYSVLSEEVAFLRETAPPTDTVSAANTADASMETETPTDSVPSPLETPAAVTAHPDAGPPVSVEDNPHWQEIQDIIGVNDIVFQPETDTDNAESSMRKEAVTEFDTEKLYDFEYLRTQFYLVDADTGLLPSDVDVDHFLLTDLTLNMSAEGPKILIFHTHSNEMYADSNPGDLFDGVMGAGARLASLLTEQYGIETLHHTGRYDIVNGKSQIPGAYERMEPAVEQILRENPSIQLVVDLHRDGLREGIPPMVTEINGQQTARIMFLNGMCRLRSNGVLAPVNGLENPYLADNMALSFRLQLTANQLYPNFTRKVYLKAYRYSLNLLPKSILVEVGAQNNTKQEALNAMEPLAEILSQVVKP